MCLFFQMNLLLTEVRGVLQVNTLEELYRLLHPNGSILGMQAGRWGSQNYYPSSKQVLENEELRSESESLAEDMPLCPHWELVRDCALLCGIEEAALQEGEMYCGSIHPEYGPRFDFTAHGPKPDPYSVCDAVLVFLTSQLIAAKATRPPQKQLNGAISLPKEERDKILARLDLANEGARIREEMPSRVFTVSGRKVGKQEALHVAKDYLGKLSEMVTGEPLPEDGKPPFYFGIKGCEQAPSRRGW